MPPIEMAGEHLLGLFNCTGMGTSTGYGLVPLSWQELKAFREENELDLLLWERELLRKMSEAYCSENYKATDPKRPAPYIPEQEEDNEVYKMTKALAMFEQMRLLREKREQ